MFIRHKKHISTKSRHYLVTVSSLNGEHLYTF